MKLLIDYGSIIAFFILSVGIILQIKKVVSTRDVKGISIWEVGLRLLASILLLIKFFYTNDYFIIIGQSIFTLIYFCYFVVLYEYKRYYEGC